MANYMGSVERTTKRIDAAQISRIGGGRFVAEASDLMFEVMEWPDRLVVVSSGMDVLLLEVTKRIRSTRNGEIESVVYRASSRDAYQLTVYND